MKTKALCFGLIFTFIFFELGLRFIGYFENNKKIASVGPKSAQYTILTLGNSYTAGVGAPKGKSYPSQLEAMLNNDGKNLYKVVNHGRGNTNTRYILDNLPRWLKENRPNLVFIMTGEPNSWNQYGLSDFMEEKNYKSKSVDLNPYLSWSKVYRLYELFSRSEVGQNDGPAVHSKTFPNLSHSINYKRTLAYQWLSHLQHGVVYHAGELDQDQAKEAIDALLYIEEQDKNPIASLLLTDLYLYKKGSKEGFFKHAQRSAEYLPYFNFDLWQMLEERKEHLSTAEDLKKIRELKNLMLTKKPLREMAEIEYWYKSKNLNGLNLKNKKEQLAFVRDMVLMIPSDTRTFIFYMENFREFSETTKEVEYIASMNPLAVSINYDRQMVEISVDRDIVRERMNFIRQKRNEIAGINGNVSMADEFALEEEWISSDIEKMIDLVEKQGAKAIVQTYPPRRHGQTRLADMVMRRNHKYYESKKAEFQDIGFMLKEKFDLKNGGVKFYSQDFGDGDDHQSAIGNTEIAKLMVEYIRPMTGKF